MSNVLVVIGTMWTWIVAYTVKKFSNFKDSFHVIDLIYHSLVTLTIISVCNVPLLLLKNEIFDNSKYPWNLVWLTATLIIVFLMSAALVLLYHKIEYKAQLRKAQSVSKKIRWYLIFVWFDCFFIYFNCWNCERIINGTYQRTILTWFKFESVFIWNCLQINS